MITAWTLARGCCPVCGGRLEEERDEEEREYYACRACSARFPQSSDAGKTVVIDDDGEL